MPANGRWDLIRRVKVKQDTPSHSRVSLNTNEGSLWAISIIFLLSEGLLIQGL